MRLKRRSILALSLLLGSCAGSNPSPAPATPVSVSSSAAAAPIATPTEDAASRPLPVDKRIKIGKLPNGLTYYILPHGKPEKRAQLWLAVNAGAVLEDDDQRGLAHFLEHMGFNGTKRFPKNSLVDFLERIGVKFGADLNAYTSFDETVYTLQTPTDKPELVSQAIRVLRDWAGDVTLDPAEVEKEKGVTGGVATGSGRRDAHLRQAGAAHLQGLALRRTVAHR
jgi:zinc protease